MSSFVGDLWKKVGELNLSNLSGNASGRPSSSFPFIFDETKPSSTRIGPFMKFEGQDYEVSSRKETSIFRRVNVLVCRDRARIDEAKRIVKSLKILKHPRILRYISSKESDSEVLLVTEWADRLTFSTIPSDEEWQTWAHWSVKEVYQFLSKNAGKEISFSLETGNLWKTSSGEVKVAIFNEEYSDESFDSVMRKTFPAAHLEAAKNELIQLTESFDYLATLSSGERVNLIKRLMASKRNDFLKFLALPELIKSRRLTRSNPTSSNMNAVSSAEISLEEVQFLFLKGKELITKETSETGATDDFMFLLSELYSDLLGKHAGNPIPLTGCLLELIGSQGLGVLFTEKYAQDQLYPNVSVLLGHPLAAVREAALKALQGLCEKLSAKTIGNDVLRQLARLQGDAEGSLRFKALAVLSGTVWPKLPESLKAKICGPAVSRALADQFTPCRRSGLQLLKQGLYLLPSPEIAGKVIPAVAGVLICEDATVRGEAFECMEKLILPSLKKAMISNGRTDSNSKPAISKPMDSKPAIGKSTSTKPVSVCTEQTSISDTTSSSKSLIADPFEDPEINSASSTSSVSSTNSPQVPAPGKMRLGSIKKII